MRRLALLLLLGGCGNPAAPSALLDTYFLASIDDKPLPAPASDAPPGYLVEHGSLTFGSGRPRGSDSLVTYARTFRLPDQSVEITSIDLRYSVTGEQLRIDLCPPGAMCLVPTELVGPILQDMLVLTHRFAGQNRSVLRFHAVRPD